MGENQGAYTYIRKGCQARIDHNANSTPAASTLTPASFPISKHMSHPSITWTSTDGRAASR